MWSNRITQNLNEEQNARSTGRTILLLGVTYKPDIADERESPAQSARPPPSSSWGLDLTSTTIRMVTAWEVDGVADPPSRRSEMVAAESADLTVLLQNHRAYDLDALAGRARRVFDTRGSRWRVPSVERHLVVDRRGRMSIQDRVAKTVARGQRRLPKAALRRRHGEPPTVGRVTPSTSRCTPTPSLVQGRRRPASRSSRAHAPGDPGGVQHVMVAIGSGSTRSPTVSVHDRTIPGPAGDLPVRLYHPARTSGRADAIVWYHQGGGVVGDLDTDHTLCARCCRSRCQAVVISIDYRLAPEHPLPPDVVDALAAYQWVIDHADGLGVDPARVAVGGTSQGGKLSAAVCQQRRRDGLPAPAGPAAALSRSRHDLGRRVPGHDGRGVAPQRGHPAGSSPMAAGIDRARTAIDRRASPGLETNLAGQPPAHW